MFFKQHPNAFFLLVAGQIVVLVLRTSDPMVSCVMFFWSAWKINSTIFDRLLNKWSSDRLFNERKIIICQTVTEFIVLLFNYLAYLISSTLSEIVFIYFSQWDKAMKYLYFLTSLLAYHYFLLRRRLDFKTVSWPQSSLHESDFRGFLICHANLA